MYLPLGGNSQSNGGEFVISMQIQKLTLTRSTRINKHLFKIPSQYKCRNKKIINAIGKHQELRIKTVETDGKTKRKYTLQCTQTCGRKTQYRQLGGVWSVGSLGLAHGSIKNVLFRSLDDKTRREADKS